MLASNAGLSIIIAFITSHCEVHSDAICNSGAMDEPSCDVHCNSAYGKVPLLNTPWTHGKCERETCVCILNEEDLAAYLPRNCMKFAWSSLEGKKQIAEDEIEAKVSRLDVRQQFAMFKKAYDKKYETSAEENRRFEIFIQNLTEIDRLMAQRTSDVIFGVGPFTDLTSEEFSAMLGTLKRRKATNQLQTRMLEQGGKNNPAARRGRSPSKSRPSSPGSTSPPRSSPRGRSPSPPRSTTRRRTTPGPFVGMDPGASSSSGGQPQPRQIIGSDPSGSPILDWRIPKRLYPAIEAQNQWGRKCGACWAFSTVSAVEIHLARQDLSVTLLSKQGMIDCVQECDGCEGGDIEDGLNHMKRYGVQTAAAYPYFARTGHCMNWIPNYVRIDDITEVPGSHKLAEQLQFSPLPSVIYQPLELQHYVSGVYDSADCTNEEDKINHAVVIVGHYRDAWILRNSIGSTWGLEGHYLVKKGRCGLGLQSYEINGPFHK